MLNYTANVPFYWVLCTTIMGLIAYAPSLGNAPTTFDASRLDDVLHEAYVCRERGMMQEAIDRYNFVLTHRPEHCHAHIGLAQAYLATGNLHQGFIELEWHLGKPQPNTMLLRDLIRRDVCLNGLKILLRTEWGLGDTLQFIRYAELLHDRGATVMIELQPQLAHLVRLLPYIDHIILPSDQLIPFHMEITMLSLPIVFDTTVESVPNSHPYVYADTALVQEWEPFFNNDVNFKIGICWHGNTIHTEKKFIPLSLLLTIATVANVSLYSLQRYHGLDQLAALEASHKLTLLPDTLDTLHGNFMDTAAIMHHLDLIITVDTSIAHLAGALGKPVWLLLPHTADWRWLRSTELSAWYPTMRLFRQPVEGDWQSVIHQLTLALIPYTTRHYNS